jgi:hypothetical protein
LPRILNCGNLNSRKVTARRTMQRRAGLAQRLDYLQELGTNGIWLLPLYPSPLRDDGFDVADYETFDRPRLERP